MFGVATLPVCAQVGFDTTLNYEQIQEVLRKGIEQKSLRQQGLGWYHWALYNDRSYGRSDSAFQYLARSIDKFRRDTDTLAYHRARTEMGIWMSQRGLNSEAQPILQEAFGYFERKGQLRLLTNTLLQLSRNYMALGDTAKAFEYRRLFRDKNEILRDTLLDLTVLMEEVSRLQSKRRYREAINLSLRSLELARRSNKPDYAAQSQYNLGLLSAQDHDYTAALEHLREADLIYRSRSNNAAQRRNIYRHLAEVYQTLDSLDSAYFYAMKYAAFGDSVMVYDRNLGLERSALRYDSRVKSEAIEMLEQEKAAVITKIEQQEPILASLAVALAAVILAMFFIIRDYRHRLHTNRVIAEQREELNQQKIRELENSLRLETMQSMLEGQEVERQRIAHDLHDSLGGLLSAAILQLDNLSNQVPALQENHALKKLRSLLDETVADARQIARNLQPVSLERFGLVRTVQDLVNHMSGKAGPNITFQHFGSSETLRQPNALHCYRIIQELLQNSLKHAAASDILVQITQTPSEIAILVEDDGVGFDPETVTKGMGTGNVAQRVHFLKGELTVESEPGKGCSTHITIPIDKI